MRENVIVRHFMPRTIYVRGFSFAQKGEKTMKKINVRKLTGIAMLSAVAFALQFLEFPIPIIPSFIKLDFSDLPELIGAFAYGPAAGVIIALIKNLLHMTQSSSMYIGELSNFLMGAVLSLTAGLIYKHKKTKKGALIASLAASLLMGIASVPINYFIVYPLYYNVLGLPEQAVAGYVQSASALNKIHLSGAAYLQPSVYRVQRTYLLRFQRNNLQTAVSAAPRKKQLTAKGEFI